LALIALQVPNAMWTAVFTSIPLVMVQQEVPGGSGAVSSLYSVTFPVAQMSAGALLGVVAALAGYRSVFWVCVALCVLALALLLCRAASRGRPGDERATARGDRREDTEIVGMQLRGDPT
jgi:SET family sugar efflux transporter-like MFS transporter